MESIITSFKKRQRQIIESFVHGYNSFPTHWVTIDIVESEVKDEIKFVFQDVSGVRQHVEKINLMEYRLNDYRSQVINERLRQIVYNAEKQLMLIKSPTPINEEDEEVIYNILIASSLDFTHEFPKDANFAVGVAAKTDPDNWQIVGYGKTLEDAFCEFQTKFNLQQELGNNKEGLTIKLRSV